MSEAPSSSAVAYHVQLNSDPSLSYHPNGESRQSWYSEGSILGEIDEVGMTEVDGTVEIVGCEDCASAAELGFDDILGPAE